MQNQKNSSAKNINSDISLSHQLEKNIESTNNAEIIQLPEPSQVKDKKTKALQNSNNNSKTTYGYQRNTGKKYVSSRKRRS